MSAFLDKLSVGMLLLLTLTLGLSPFLPEPHIWEKIKMLFSAKLTKPFDMFDLLFHGVPWLLLGAKFVRLGWLARVRNRDM